MASGSIELKTRTSGSPRIKLDIDDNALVSGLPSTNYRLTTAKVLDPTMTMGSIYELPAISTVKPQHRPLHSQVAALLMEKKALLATFESLTAENAEVWSAATRTKASLDELQYEHEAAVLTKNELASKLDSATDVLGIVSSGAMETVQQNRSMRAQLEHLDAKCRELAGRLALQSQHANREHSNADETRVAAAVERSIWREEIAQNDAELQAMSAQLDTSLDEALWLRVKLAKAEEEGEALRQAVAAGRTENAQLASALRQSRSEARVAVEERGTTEARLTQQLAGARREASELHAQLRASQTRCDALKSRVDQCDAARVDALVVAGRADALLEATHVGTREAAGVHDALRRHLDEATKDLQTAARAAEVMRETHSDDERLRLVASAWSGVVQAGAVNLERIQRRLPDMRIGGGALGASTSADAASPSTACHGLEFTPRTSSATTMPEHQPNPNTPHTNSTASGAAPSSSGWSRHNGPSASRMATPYDAAGSPSWRESNDENAAGIAHSLVSPDSGFALAASANAYAAASRALAEAAVSRLRSADAAFEPNRRPLGLDRTPPNAVYQQQVPSLAKAAWGSSQSGSSVGGESNAAASSSHSCAPPIRNVHDVHDEARPMKPEWVHPPGCSSHGGGTHASTYASYSRAAHQASAEAKAAEAEAERRRRHSADEDFVLGS